jgi:hypothetical protein
MTDQVENQENNQENQVESNQVENQVDNQVEDLSLTNFAKPLEPKITQTQAQEGISFRDLAKIKFKEEEFKEFQKFISEQDKVIIEGLKNHTPLKQFQFLSEYYEKSTPKKAQVETTSRKRSFDNVSNAVQGKNLADKLNNLCIKHLHDSQDKRFDIER